MKILTHHSFVVTNHTFDRQTDGHNSQC